MNQNYGELQQILAEDSTIRPQHLERKYPWCTPPIWPLWSRSQQQWYLDRVKYGFSDEDARPGVSLSGKQKYEKAYSTKQSPTSRDGSLRGKPADAASFCSKPLLPPPSPPIPGSADAGATAYLHTFQQGAINTVLREHGAAERSTRSGRGARMRRAMERTATYFAEMEDTQTARWIPIPRAVNDYYQLEDDSDRWLAILLGEDKAETARKAHNLELCPKCPGVQVYTGYEDYLRLLSGNLTALTRYEFSRVASQLRREEAKGLTDPTNYHQHAQIYGNADLRRCIHLQRCVGGISESQIIIIGTKRAYAEAKTREAEAERIAMAAAAADAKTSQAEQAAQEAAAKAAAKERAKAAHAIGEGRTTRKNPNSLHRKRK